jgi:hypothetical protein
VKGAGRDAHDGKAGWAGVLRGEEGMGVGREGGGGEGAWDDEDVELGCV